MKTLPILFEKILKYLAYPLLLLLGYGVYFFLAPLFPISDSDLDARAIHIVRVAITIFCLSLVFIFAEYFFPYRKTWKPRFKEVITDSFYLVIVQGAIPYLFFYFVIQNRGEWDTVVAFESSSVFSFLSWERWLGHFPLAIQVMFFIVLGEFFQYWWHRGSHRFKSLWSFHLIHHLPKKLYWLNAARFHCVDKFVEFFLTVFIFLLLGAEERVFFCYLIFYVVNGYAQHSNIDFRFGILNYFLSTPTLHRWHHNVDPKKAKCNYGSNVIIWDIVFGTFYYPKNNSSVQTKEHSTLGVGNFYLPENFIKHFFYPFKVFFFKIFFKALFDSIFNRILNTLMFLQMSLVNRRIWEKFVKTTHDPKGEQERTLQKILNRNQTSKWGRQFFFSKISSVKDFQTKVPISTYDDLAPWIEENKKTPNTLYSDKTVLYVKTSGTSNTPKHIPITETGEKNYIEGQKMFVYSLYKNFPNAFKAKYFSIISTERDDIVLKKKSKIKSESVGTSGSISGYLAYKTSFLILSKHSIPLEVLGLEDYDLKFLYLSVFALLDKDVLTITTANPSNLLRLLEFINSEKEEIRNLLTQKFNLLKNKNHDKKIKNQIIKKAQGDNLVRALSLLEKKKLTFVDIFPNLQLINVWIYGSCGLLIPKLRKSIPSQTAIVDLGYVSSEFFGAITIDTIKNHTLPLLQHHFYEFVLKEDWDRGIRVAKAVKLIHELEEGKRYYIIVTTCSGLYRYFINDILEVREKYNNTPILRFVQKGNGVTNITGEKITETQLIHFFNSRELKGKVDFFICLADSKKMQYELFLESDRNCYEYTLSRLQNYLCEVNIEYEAKVKSKRLKEIKISLLKKGTIEVYKRHRLAKGQNSIQYKFLYLQYHHDNDFGFDKHTKQNKKKGEMKTHNKLFKHS